MAQNNKPSKPPPFADPPTYFGNNSQQRHLPSTQQRQPLSTQQRQRPSKAFEPLSISTPRKPSETDNPLTGSKLVFQPPGAAPPFSPPLPAGNRA